MTDILDGQDHSVYLGDTIPHMFSAMPENSVDSIITSVPFPSVFSYTNLDEDLGNSEDLAGTTKLHFNYLFRAMLRVLKPGRVASIHCMNFHRRKGNRQGVFDFKGMLIRVAERAGWIYDNDWMIWVNAQSEAVRTHAHGLLFVTLERDRSKTRAAMANYVIKLIKPGENLVPIDSEGISRNEWIEWASPCWHGIRATKTLNTKEGKGPDDTRHICPFALDLVDRLIRLYSNPGEIIFDPFAGIGSTGYQAIKLNRRFYGTELKQEYYNAAMKNLRRAKAEVKDATPLFNMLKDDETEGDGEPEDTATQDDDGATGWDGSTDIDSKWSNDPFDTADMHE